MPFLERPGARLFYETWQDGSGPWVTLINGHTRTTSDFRMMARYLCERGFRVIACDNRGCGQTSVDRDFSLPEMVDDIVAMLDAEGVAKSHVLGISMGGMIAQWLASHFPERVDRLVLVSTCPNRSFIADHGSYEWSSDEAAVRSRLSGYFSKDFLARNQPLVQAMAKQMAQAAGGNAHFLSNARRQMEAMRGFDALPWLKEIKSPTLVIHGGEDAIVPLAAGRLLVAQIAGAKFLEIEGAGHLLVAEVSRTLYEETARYLA